MNMNKDQVSMAVRAGMELLGPESEVAIPAKLNDGIFLLKMLLSGIGAGQIALAPNTDQKPPVVPPPEPSDQDD